MSENTKCCFDAKMCDSGIRGVISVLHFLISRRTRDRIYYSNQTWIQCMHSKDFTQVRTGVGE